MLGYLEVIDSSVFSSMLLSIYPRVALLKFLSELCISASRVHHCMEGVHQCMEGVHHCMEECITAWRVVCQPTGCALVVCIVHT